jgi:glycosyltransferase involved in cell wall biosynthesis
VSRCATPRRVAFVNWTRRQAGGVETYVDFLLSAVAATGCQVALWTEQDHPVERDCVTVPEGATEWCAALDDPERSLEALRRWSPSALLVHGVADPVVEARLLAIAPAVFVAHTYTGTCISSRKTLTFPQPRPCDRVFGPACLALFYPRRCGGLHPVTMIRDYRRQTTQLELIRAYSHVLTMSQHMRREYVRHGVAPHRVHALPPYPPSITSLSHVQGASVPNVTTLLFVGRIERLKGCRLLIEGLPGVQARLGKPVRLIIAGDGPDRVACERLAARARSSQVEIEFRGWVDAASRSRLLGAAAALVMPSVWPEPYGLSGLEAIAAGVPVAAFRTGAIPEWLHDGVGRLAPGDPPTSAGLEDAILGCLTLGRFQSIPEEELRQEQARHVAAVCVWLDEAAANGTPMSA